jgi:hypothetical protein
MDKIDVEKGNKFIVSCMNFDGGEHRWCRGVGAKRAGSEQKARKQRELC